MLVRWHNKLKHDLLYVHEKEQNFCLSVRQMTVQQLIIISLSCFHCIMEYSRADISALNPTEYKLVIINEAASSVATVP